MIVLEKWYELLGAGLAAGFALYGVFCTGRGAYRRTRRNLPL